MLHGAEHRHSPNPRNPIGVQNAVGTDHGEALNYGLSNQQTVKRIAVMKRQIQNFGEVIDLGRHQFNVIPSHFTRNQNAIRFGQFELAQTDFNRNFPKRHDTNENLVGRILNQVKSVQSELVFPLNKPEEAICVQEQCHLMSSVTWCTE